MESMKRSQNTKTWTMSLEMRKKENNFVKQKLFTKKFIFVIFKLRWS